jgi:2-dehydropantoate 2-reductase
MKIAIVGSGAMGCYFASMLSKSQHNKIFMVTRNRNQIRKIRQKGIRITHSDGAEELFNINIDFAPNITEEMDVVLILVKSQDTENAMRCARHLIYPHTFVGTFQNGLGNVETMVKYVEPSQVFCGSWVHSVMRTGLNNLHYSGGRGPLRLAKYIPDRFDKFDMIVNAIKKSGFEVEVAEDWREVIWNKVVMNSGGNALSAITRMSCGILTENPFLREIVKLTVRETVQVARANGVSLHYQEPPELILLRALASMGKNEPSMLQDLKLGKSSEVDFINLAVAKEGEKIGFDAPVNRVLGLMLKFFEGSKAYDFKDGGLLEGNSKLIMNLPYRSTKDLTNTAGASIDHLNDKS